MAEETKKQQEAVPADQPEATTAPDTAEAQESAEVPVQEAAPDPLAEAQEELRVWKTAKRYAAVGKS